MTSNKLPRMGIILSGMPPKDMLTIAQEAEEAGFYSAAAGDSTHDTYAVLAAAAAVTNRIKLVSNIATWTRTPVTTARACRSLALLSGGRYILGLGSMPRVWNENHHGISGESMLSRMREYMELVRILWEATPDVPVNYEGRFYRVSGYRVHEPPPYPRIPVFIGASRLRMVRETGRRADGILFNLNYTIPWLKEQGIPALTEGAKLGGRSLDDIEMVGFRMIRVAETPDEAEHARGVFRRQLAEVYLGLDYHRQALEAYGFGEEVAAATRAQAAGDTEGVARAVSDRMVNSLAIIGTADECLERVAENTALTDWVSLAPLTTGLPGSEAISAARRVIHTFRRASQG